MAEHRQALENYSRAIEEQRNRLGQVTQFLDVPYVALTHPYTPCTRCNESPEHRPIKSHMRETMKFTPNPLSHFQLSGCH